MRSRLPSASARPTDFENTPADRPYSLLLASSTASSSVREGGDRRDRSEHLLVEGAHAGLDAGEHGRPVERTVEGTAGARAWRPAATVSLTMPWMRSTWERLITGPSATCPVVGSPTGRCLALATSFSVNASTIFSCAMTRPVVMQIWPWWNQAPKAMAEATAVEIGILEHDHGVLAAELELHLLQVLAGELADAAADRARSGERRPSQCPDRCRSPRRPRRRRAGPAARPWAGPLPRTGAR